MSTEPIKKPEIVFLYSAERDQRFIDYFTDDFTVIKTRLNDWDGPGEADLYVFGPVPVDQEILALCQAIKQPKEKPTPVVIFINDQLSTEQKLELYHNGVDDLIPIDIHPKEFVLKIEKHSNNKQYIDYLKAVNDTKVKFLSIIAHDLRNPFTILLNFTDILLQRFDQFSVDSQKDYLKYISESAKKSYSILENLLRWSMANTDEIQFLPVRIDLTDIINESVLLHANLINEKEITVYFDHSQKKQINADMNMIKVIINALLENAIKYSYPKGNIILTTTLESDQCTIEITDKGTGIENNKLGNLFKLDKVYKTPGTLNESGTGLSLFIIKEFIEKHGGELGVKSTVGEGSTFTVVLPTVA